MGEAEDNLGQSLLGLMDEREGLPRPDWGKVRARWLALPDDERPAAWSAVERAWQRALAEAWGDDFRLLEQGESLLTTDLPDAEAQRVLRFINSALSTIMRCLTKLGLAKYSDGVSGLDVTVVCRRVEDYLDFICDVDDEQHAGAVSGGMCIRQISVHIAAHGASAANLEPVLAHELAHGRLTELDLPVWLEEGLVTHLENAVAPNGAYDPHPQMIELHRSYWTPGRIDAFFSGEGFCGSDDAYGLTYLLAHSVVGTLMNADRSRFTRLLEMASREDRGEAACREVYDVSLVELLPTFIRAAAAANAELTEESGD